MRSLNRYASPLAQILVLAIGVQSLGFSTQPFREPGSLLNTPSLLFSAEALTPALQEMLHPLSASTAALQRVWAAGLRRKALLRARLVFQPPIQVRKLQRSEGSTVFHFSANWPLADAEHPLAYLFKRPLISFHPETLQPGDYVILRWRDDYRVIHLHHFEHHDGAYHFYTQSIGGYSSLRVEYSEQPTLEGIHLNPLNLTPLELVIPEGQVVGCILPEKAKSLWVWIKSPPQTNKEEAETMLALQALQWRRAQQTPEERAAHQQDYWDALQAIRRPGVMVVATRRLIKDHVIAFDELPTGEGTVRWNPNTDPLATAVYQEVAARITNNIYFNREVLAEMANRPATHFVYPLFADTDFLKWVQEHYPRSIRVIAQTIRGLAASGSKKSSEGTAAITYLERYFPINFEAFLKTEEWLRTRGNPKRRMPLPVDRASTSPNDEKPVLGYTSRSAQGEPIPTTFWDMRHIEVIHRLRRQWNETIRRTEIHYQIPSFKEQLTHPQLAAPIQDSYRALLELLDPAKTPLTLTDFLLSVIWTSTKLMHHFTTTSTTQAGTTLSQNSLLQGSAVFKQLAEAAQSLLDQKPDPISEQWVPLFAVLGTGNRLERPAGGLMRFPNEALDLNHEGGEPQRSRSIRGLRTHDKTVVVTRPGQLILIRYNRLRPLVLYSSNALTITFQGIDSQGAPAFAQFSEWDSSDYPQLEWILNHLKSYGWKTIQAVVQVNLDPERETHLRARLQAHGATLLRYPHPTQGSREVLVDHEQIILRHATPTYTEYVTLPSPAASAKTLKPGNRSGSGALSLLVGIILAGAGRWIALALVGNMFIAPTPRPLLSRAA